jgi:hypothetical protein
MKEPRLVHLHGGRDEDGPYLGFTPNTVQKHDAHSITGRSPIVLLSVRIDQMKRFLLHLVRDQVDSRAPEAVRG